MVIMKRCLLLFFLCLSLILSFLAFTSGETALAANNGWKKENGSWYYYLDSGRRATGWIKSNSKWYYLYRTGKMATGWVKVSSKWYYLNKNGDMRTGWIKSGTTWYYLDPSGAMATGWRFVNGKWYFLKSSGAMATGWIKHNSKWYYLNSDGSMATGWLKTGGSYYYLNSSGAMVTGWQYIGGKWYFFSDSGSAYKNQWLKSGINWYYLGNDCSMLSNTSITINGTTYYFDAGGRWISDQQLMLEKTATSKKTNQIVLVVGHNLTFWNKNSAGSWVKEIDAYCGYGKNGFISASSMTEYSNASPIGSFPITLAFGRGSNPGTSMTYRRITSNSYWSSANNSTYNTWVESSTPITGEQLIRYSEYRYALAVGFNINPIVYGRGSAIFVHCKSTSHWDTAGCISLEENYMLSLMKRLKNGAYIIIVPNISSMAAY